MHFYAWFLLCLCDPFSGSYMKCLEDLNLKPFWTPLCSLPSQHHTHYLTHLAINTHPPSSFPTCQSQPGYPAQPPAISPTSTFFLVPLAVFLFFPDHMNPYYPFSSSYIFFSLSSSLFLLTLHGSNKSSHSHQLISFPIIVIPLPKLCTSIHHFLKFSCNY